MPYITVNLIYFRVLVGQNKHTMTDTLMKTLTHINETSRTVDKSTEHRTETPEAISKQQTRTCHRKRSKSSTRSQWMAREKHLTPERQELQSTCPTTTCYHITKKHVIRIGSQFLIVS